METAFLLLAIAVAVLACTALARRLDVPAPLLLIAVGIGVSYLPDVPEIHLHHHVVLLGLLPPLLYAAALRTSLVDFHAHRRPILLLSVGLVVFTTLGVGAVVHLLLPGVSWPVALAIGAVVSPPDAVAATSIARRIGLPRRIVTILEGESLLNDATALVALRTAIAGLGVVTLLEVGLDFVVAAGGGALLGVVAYVVVAWLRRWVTDPVLDSAISLVTPFAAYLAAERIHGSGVIAVVVAGLLLGHQAPVLQSAQSRIADQMNWRTIAFLLENAVFFLIGLQARWIIDGVRASQVPVSRVAVLCVATLAAVVLLRFAWVFATRFLLTRDGAGPWSHSVLVGWAGMRGVVTLAAAFVIPADTEQREILLMVAFAVVAGTLFAQGLTLPWLARGLRVPGPDPAEDALARATLLQQASKAGFEELDRLEAEDPHGVLDLIRQRVEQRNFAAWERLATVAEDETPSELYARARLAMIQAERRRVLEIRSAGNVAAEVVSEVLAMLDVEESMLDAASQEREGLIAATAGGRLTGATCEHLETQPAVETPAEPVCSQCVAEGIRWVALRECLTCGHVACCDSSPRRHATAHFHETAHPVVETAEPGEDWRWCYVHHVTG